jgi:hypothetical protein
MTTLRPGSASAPPIGPLTAGALAAAALAAVVIGLQARPAFFALFADSAALGDVRETVKEQSERYAAGFDPHLAQIRGRALFLVPIVVADATAAPPEEPDDEPQEPERAATYAGPGVIAMINDSVWFSSGARIKAGEEADGVKVLAVDAPWSARLLWRGGEFTVNLFERDGVVFREARTAPRSANIVDADANADEAQADAPPPPEPAKPAATPPTTPPTTPASSPGSSPPASPAPTEPSPAPEPAPSEPAAPDTDPAAPDPAPAEPSPSEPAPQRATAQPTASAPSSSDPRNATPPPSFARRIAAVPRHAKEHA